MERGGVAQQVRQAATLTAELAAQSEEKISAVCDHPLGLRDESAEKGNVEPRVPRDPFSFSDTEVTTSPSLVTGTSGLADLAGRFRERRGPRRESKPRCDSSGTRWQRSCDEVESTGGHAMMKRRSMGTLLKTGELHTEDSSTSQEDAVMFGNERPRAPRKPQPCLRRDPELLRQSNW